MGLVARQGLRLLVVVVLQPVLQAAQERVGGAKVAHAGGLQEAAFLDGVERRAGRLRAQPRVTPASHHLEELCGELDLADAARAHLDVVRLAPRLRGLGDAPVHLAQRLEHAVVEVAPVHEGLDPSREALAGPRPPRAPSSRRSAPRAARAR
jgi:hypothetical protein